MAQLEAISITDRKSQILEKLAATRERTLWMLEQVPDDFLRVRVHSFYSPIGWHFGHVGRTEEYWVCAATDAEPIDARLSFLYADLPENPKDNRVNVPDRNGVIEYLARTREAAQRQLEFADLESENPFLADGYAWEFAIQHECQHQETIAEMLQLIQKQLPAQEVSPKDWRAGIKHEWIDVRGGTFTMGDSDRHGYDNEKDPHPVSVEAFQIGRFPVTSHQWTEFMRDGGYSRAELWSEDGWDWKLKEEVSMPEYWFTCDNGYGYYGPLGARAIHPDEPVSCVSRFEAEAFARWKGARLPTEQEREYVASSGPDEDVQRRYPWGNEAPTQISACFGLRDWGPTPVGRHPNGAGPLGVEELAGNVWEWTSSAFLPYRGFNAFPYDGYSKDHMKGKHCVCRGGSWATSGPILRCSFRNWYVPSYRQGFLGVRLAR